MDSRPPVTGRDPLSDRSSMRTVIYLVARVAQAMSGALAAGRRSMDVFGVAVIASVTTLSGGTVRDLILGHFSIGRTQHPDCIDLVIGAGLLATLVAGHMHRRTRRLPGLRERDMSVSISPATSFTAGLAPRLLATCRGWRLPTSSYPLRWE